jgi:hypothetical protein
MDKEWMPFATPQRAVVRWRGRGRSRYTRILAWRRVDLRIEYLDDYGWIWEAGYHEHRPHFVRFV